MIHRSFILSLAVLLLVGCGEKESGLSQRADRVEAALFTLESLDGHEYSLESARGNVVLLDFWATWCPPCKKEIPELISIYNKYKEKEFLLWGIGLDKPDALNSWSEKFEIPYPVLIGSQKIQSAYGVRAIPTVFIIDKTGRIAARFQGYRQGVEAQFEEEIGQLLRE